MRAVAKWGLFTVFATTEKHLFGLLQGKLHWKKPGVLMGAIAKRLVGRAATSTPKVVAGL